MYLNCSCHICFVTWQP